MTGRIHNKETFVQKASLKHGGKFDYSKFEYLNAKSRSIIICPVHGEFEQTSDKHMQSKHGCYECARIFIAEASRDRDNHPTFKRESISKEQFLERVRLKHGDKFGIDLSNYFGFTKGTVTIICLEHGSSTYVPQAFISSECGCRECGSQKKNTSKTRSYEDFIDNVTRIHQNKYTYPESNKEVYENRKSVITVVCSIHGEFTKKAQKHLSGQGCFECLMESNVKDGLFPGGYREKVFRENPKLKEKPGCVYYMKVGHLYKIGISTNLKRRVSSLRSLSKEKVVLIQSYECELYEAYQIEKKILKKFGEHRCKVSWSTELFTKDILLEIPLHTFK